MTTTDWKEWHEAYDRPGSTLAARLVEVRRRIHIELDTAPAGEIRIISLCAGEGRDVLDVLADHPRRSDARAVLVELDPTLAERARDRVRRYGLTGVRVVTGDAADLTHCADYAPADLVLLCGIFGNITDADIQRTIRHSRGLCRPGASVIWTRHRKEPDMVPTICEWFVDHGFTERYVSPPDVGYGVAVHRYEGPPQPLDTGVRLFEFVR